MVMLDNEERELRILNAAADLFVRYGYGKTTVNDVARQAGVSKGTIYLHFDSKDDLLENVIIRELKTYAEQWLQLIEADPEGGTIAGMYKNSLYALNKSAFMQAMFTRDRCVLGNYLRKPDNFFRDFRAQEKHSPRYQFVKLMQAAGAVRPELDPKVVAYIMDILAFGLVGMDEIAASGDRPPAEEVIEGIAEIMDRALTPDDGGNPQAGKAIVRQLTDAALKQFEQLRNLTQE